MKHNDIMKTLQKMNLNNSKSTQNINETKQQDDSMKKMELERQRKAGL